MSIDWREYLKTQGAQFDNNDSVEFPVPPQSRHSNIVSLLSSQSFIRITGPDSQKFLQGQISVDVDKLTPSGHSIGVACTPKGRMYTGFRILNEMTDHYLLSMDKGLTESTLSTLGKYAVFFKTTLCEDDAMIGLGLAGQEIDKVLEHFNLPVNDLNEALIVDQGHLLKIPGNCPRYELWMKKDALSYWWENLSSCCTPVAEGQWRLLDIEAVIPRVRPEFSEKYIPQHLNLPSLGAISFRKGCYTGQEIVTRMQNLGQQKSRTFYCQIETRVAPQPGDRVYDQNGKAVGEVLESIIAQGSDITELLAVIRIEQAENNTVFLDSDQNTPLKVNPIPYNIDPKAELQQ